MSLHRLYNKDLKQLNHFRNYSTTLEKNMVTHPQRIVCIGAIVMQNKQVLLVRQAQGHDLAGQWTIPWGFLDDDEIITNAVHREVMEEAGLSVHIEGLLGFQELPVPWLGWLALIFLCNASGEPRPDGVETDATRFFSRQMLDSFNEPVESWCRWLAIRTLKGDFTLLKENHDHPYIPQLGFF
jgi:ADP-ribose pyrophosphatase YjhB (NUDIX family)